MTYYTREQWGSAYDRGGYEIGQVSEFYVHHFAGGMRPTTSVEESMARMRSVQRSHVGNGWSDIGYSFVVDNLGNIYEGRGWGQSGAHTYGYNSRGYACAWMGDSTVELPSHLALQAIAAVAVEGTIIDYLIPDPTVVAHRDRVPDTACCGDPMYAYMPRIRELIGASGGSTELHTRTPVTALPRWNGDFDMHICLYKPTPEVNLYLLVFGDGTFKILNPSQDMAWELINSKLVQLANAGLVPKHADGTVVVGEIFDDGLAELKERP